MSKQELLLGNHHNWCCAIKLRHKLHFTFHLFTFLNTQQVFKKMLFIRLKFTQTVIFCRSERTEWKSLSPKDWTLSSVFSRNNVNWILPIMTQTFRLYSNSLYSVPILCHSIALNFELKGKRKGKDYYTIHLMSSSINSVSKWCLLYQ